MKKLFFIFLITVLMVQFGFSIDDARLLRFPTINKDLVAFVYAGDIWSVPAAGGTARQLTSHEGLELFPRISPDGKWIAYSAEYSGTRQVYVMPVEGGTPKQLTYYNDMGELLPPRGGFDHIVLGWTPDSKQILLMANRTPYDERIQKFYMISIDGGLETPLQIPEGGFGSFSPDAKQLVYTPISREFRTWKRYKGGRAQDVWIYNLEKNTSERITNFTGTDQHPFWFNDKIFFVSDQDLKLNFWSYDLKTKEYKQVTFHKEFDVLWPSGNNGLLAYENGGYIYILNLSTGESHKITVNINFDNPNRLPYFKNVTSFISTSGAGLSPEGKKAVFDARGDLFTVPAEKSVITNVTRTQGIREMFPSWSPDGKWIAYISDVTGDYELYIMDPEKKKETVQLTVGHKIWKSQPVWSPDGKKLLFHDTDQKLVWLDIATKKMTDIDKGYLFRIDTYSWSGDSRWVVYNKDGRNKLQEIWVYSLDTGKTIRVSSGRYNDSDPVFSKCGRYIFFISDRDFNLAQLKAATLDNSFIYSNTSRIYSLALVKNAPNLFEDENNAVVKAKPEIPKTVERLGKPIAPAVLPQVEPVTIDFDGIQERVTVFPLNPDAYFSVVDIGGKIVYQNSTGYRIYDIKSKEDKKLISDVTKVVFSPDYTKFLYSDGISWGITDLKPEQKAGNGRLNLKDLVMKIDPLKEWKQMFEEGYRIYRDFFYVHNMHNVDWKKMKEKYAPMVEYAGHRTDIVYLLSELVGELNVGHAYVNYGDFKKPVRVEGGLLGAEFTADKKAGRYIISKIFKGNNWDESTRSPLTEQGVDIKEGEYLIRIDDNKVTTDDNPFMFLENTFGKKISITVNTKPVEEGARTYWVKPIQHETNLRYMDWVESRRKLVDTLSNGRIGYIHLPNTGEDGFREFYKGLYAYNDKEAFIIDDRYNGGGSFPTQMIYKMKEVPTSYWTRKFLDLGSDPEFLLYGPKAMLINGYSSSGGDFFPYMFQSLKLGKLIGTRTWGGLVGYSTSHDLVDNASFAVPLYSITDTEGKYVVEGTGVNPDIEVIDRPEEIARGNDPCISEAIKQLLDELDKNPHKKPVKHSDPDRSKWHEEMPNNNSTGFEKK